MPVFFLMPQDVMWLRECPAENSFAGDLDLAFLQWLAPSALFGALHVALHETFPQVQLTEHLHPWGLNGNYSNLHEHTQRFGSLSTVGPFPCQRIQRQTAWFFPMPSDVFFAKGQKAGDATDIEAAIQEPSISPQNRLKQPMGWMLPMDQYQGKNSLPTPLKYALGLYGEKAIQPGTYWWGKEALESYLQQSAPPHDDVLPQESLYSICFDERRNRRQKGHSGNKQTFQIRFKEDSGLGFSASMLQEGGKEGLNTLFFGKGHFKYPVNSGNAFRVFPQYEASLESVLPMSPNAIQNRLKWLLLSPAVFPESAPVTGHKTVSHPGGWLPNWVCPETGQVLLRTGRSQRKKSESRAEWRIRLRNEGDAYRCHLVAASIKGFQEIGGWSYHKHTRLHDASAQPGPKPKYHAVPAGSVYYFEGPDASALAEKLAWHGNQRSGCAILNRRSVLWGEKGMGIGVCGPWSVESEFTPEKNSTL